MANFNITSKIKSVTLGTSTASAPETVIVTDVKLPTDAPARVKTLKSEGRKWYLTVAYHPDTEQPFALFCHTNHKEKSIATTDAVDKLIDLARSKGILEDHISTTIEKCKSEPNISKLTRTISLLLRHNVAIRNIVSTLDQVSDVSVASFLFQVKKFLSQYIKNGEIVETEKCPSCGGTLVFSEGCMTCRDCGHSKCG
jgi:hypothetical protein